MNSCLVLSLSTFQVCLEELELCRVITAGNLQLLACFLGLGTVSPLLGPSWHCHMMSVRVADWTKFLRSKGMYIGVRSRYVTRPLWHSFVEMALGRFGVARFSFKS